MLNRKRILYLLTGFILLIIVCLFFIIPSWHHSLIHLFQLETVASIRKYVRSLGVWGPIFSMLIMVLHSVTFIPSEIVTFANLAVFGPFWGFVYTWMGSMLGAYFSFFLAKIFGRRLIVDKFVSPRMLNRFDQFIEKQGIKGLFALRLIPVISFNALNYASGLTTITFWQFTWTTGLGIAPAGILFALLYQSVTGLKYAFIGLSIAGVFILLVLFFKHRLKKLQDTSKTTNDRTHHFFMRIMVWMMRWMTRYVGFIARPIIRIYGNNEIIACGMRNEDNSVAVIYTPKTGHQNHEVLLREGRQWVPEITDAMESFSGSVVSRLSVPHAQNGKRCKMVGVTANGRRLSSPTITVKPTTIYDSTLLRIESTTRRNVLFTWPRAETDDPMIYFLAIEDETGEKTYAAIYTRETFWCYPKTKTASYSVGPAEPPPLDPRTRYVAKLVLVDYDGWVSHIAVRSFSVP